MVPCKYQSALKCDKCNVIFYNECKSFRVAHLQYLSQDIRPFKFKSDLVLNSNVVWSKSVNLAKSAALIYASNRDCKIKKVTLSQVLAIQIDSLEFDAQVCYIECNTRITGDVDKVKSCLVSFIERQILNNCACAVFVNQQLTFNLDYHKL